MGGAVSSGRDNNELIDNLVGGNYIRTASVEQVFRALDRADYMTRRARDQAYKDLAWRDGSLHLSAPCIYSEVMEGLELKPGLSFLNIGSGTGYLSTLVGLIIGASGISHGVEIVPSVVEYANKRLGQFMANSPTLDELDFCEPRFYCGNGLRLAPLAVGYDRVYCGAGCPDEYNTYFRHLIKVGGILIMPLNDSLVQVRRESETRWSSSNLLNVSFASLRAPPPADCSELLRLEEQSPARLSVLSRSVIRACMRASVRRGHPELRAPATPRPPPRAPPAKRQCPRRIVIPVDDESDELAAEIDALHDLDRESGGTEMNALLSLVLNMGTNRAAGSLRVLDSDEDDDDDDDDGQLPQQRHHRDRSTEQSSSESESGGPPARGPPPRDRNVLVFSLQDAPDHPPPPRPPHPPFENDTPHSSASSSPTPSSPRFGADNLIYPPEYNRDDDASCDEPSCLNYKRDRGVDSAPEETTEVNSRVTRSQAKRERQMIEKHLLSRIVAVPTSSTESTPERPNSDSDSSIDEQPSTSKASNLNSESMQTRSKLSKQNTTSPVKTRKPVTRSDSKKKSKIEGKRIAKTSKVLPSASGDSKARATRPSVRYFVKPAAVDFNPNTEGKKGSKSSPGAKGSKGNGEESPGTSDAPGTSAMQWGAQLQNMDVEDDSSSCESAVSEPLLLPRRRRQTDSGVGTGSTSPHTSISPTASGHAHAHSNRGRRRRVKRRHHVASRASDDCSSSPPAEGEGGERGAPRTPRPTPGAVRVRLSTLMKQSVKDLPLPYELKRYVNFYRVFQL